MDLGCICSRSFKLNLYQKNLTKYYSAPLPISCSDFQLDKIEKTGLPSCFKEASWFVSFTFLTQQRRAYAAGGQFRRMVSWVCFLKDLNQNNLDSSHASHVTMEKTSWLMGVQQEKEQIYSVHSYMANKLVKVGEGFTTKLTCCTTSPSRISVT